MIKNIILDVGKVLVEWDTEYAFRKMGFDEETRRAVAAATVASPDWNELDRSLLSDEELLEKMIGNAPGYERENPYGLGEHFPVDLAVRLCKTVDPGDEEQGVSCIYPVKLQPLYL